jgi:hypothetical protein
MKTSIHEWLNRPTALTYDIRAKIRIAEELRSCLLPTAIRYDKDKVMTSYGTNADPMAEITARVDAIEREIAELQRQKACAIIELEDVFSQLDRNEHEVMSRYYITRKSISVIAKEMVYQRRSVYDLRAKGIEHVEQILKNSQ